MLPFVLIMNQIRIVIEKSADYFNAYAQNVEGIYAAGETVAEVKQSVEDAIRLLIKYNDAKNIPTVLKRKYELVYKFDMQSLLSYYKKILTNSGLEKITGINQKQIQHYASGHKSPRPEQTKKIELALHELGRELLAVQL